MVREMVILITLQQIGKMSTAVILGLTLGTMDPMMDLEVDGAMFQKRMLK